MFEDLEEESVDVTPESPDRAIAWAIASRDESSNVTPDEGWAILQERYPDDVRFLILSIYSEINASKKQESGTKTQNDTLTAPYLLKKIERVNGGDPTGAFEPQLKELVVFAATELATGKGDDATTVRDLRDRLGIEGESKRDDRDRAALKLRRFEREVLKEIDDRTQDGRALGVARVITAPKKKESDWASATSDGSRPRRKYAADARFEAGELVEHSKFGVGVVTGTEPGKAVILFESGVRKLVAGA